MSGISLQCCATFLDTTKVMSPEMMHFSNASTGDALYVRLDGDMVVLLNSSGDTVGSINPSWITNLIYSIKKGNNYEAVISHLIGTSIDVTIQSL